MQLKRPIVSVSSYAVLGSGLARINASVIHAAGSREDHALVTKSLSKYFDNKLAVVEGSFRCYSKNSVSEQISGLIRVNTECVALTDENEGSFRALSSNIYVDNEDKMWQLRASEGGRLLVKETGIGDEDALESLLQHAIKGGSSFSSAEQVSLSNAAEIANKICSTLEGGSYVVYASSLTNKTEHGFVVATAEDGFIVVSSDTGAEELVKPAAIVEQLATEQMPSAELSEQEKIDIAVSTSRSGVNVNQIVAYYKKVYGQHKEFFAELSKRIRGHAFI